MSKLRIARAEDYESVRRMAMEFYSTTTQSKAIPWDEETAQMLFIDMVSNGFIVLARDGDKDVGMLGCMVTPAMLNRHHKVATEIFWWVDPSHRQSRTGIEMLKLAEKVARHDECTLLVMGTLDNSPAGLGKIYERLGYKSQEESWVKEL